MATQKATSAAQTPAATPTPLQADTARKLSFDVIKHVTKTQLKLDDNGRPSYIRIDSKIYDAPAVKGERTRKNTDGAVMAPPKLVDVFNYETETEQTMIVNEVFGSELQRTYPNDGFVKKSFKVSKFKIQGKRYSTFEITEIQLKK